MKIGFMGMGKLGFPCALAAASRGHDVVGFDNGLVPYDILAARKYPHREVHAQKLLETTTLRMAVRLSDFVAQSEIIFVAVQTPHRPEFEGLTRMPESERADFDYAALKDAVRSVALEAREQKKPTTIVVISTCLPGTCQREIYPLLNEYTGFVYNPFFIAMGNAIDDYLEPELVLLGYDHAVDKVDSLDRVQRFYRGLHASTSTSNIAFDRDDESPPHAVMSVASAELTKVAYNVFLGLKIVAANSIMEIAHKTGANCDDVTNALALATDRVVSSKYMRGGMGDGGACHPRDQIALSWLADVLDLSYDLFGAMIKAREAQTEWLADLADEEARKTGLPIVILGKAYKNGTNLTYGSPAILLKNICDEFGMETTQYDPHVDAEISQELGQDNRPRVFVVATDHDEFFKMAWPPGSVVIDPWGKVVDQDGVKVVRVGRNGSRAPAPATTANDLLES